MSNSRVASSAWAFRLALSCILGLGWSSSPVSAAPNIVLILSDDQGWNGTSVQMDPNVAGSKSDFYQTPRLEQLAASGMRFSQGYAASPVCATTRAALQAGRSPAQLQLGDMPQALPAGSARWLGSFEGLPLTPPMPAVFDPNNYTLPRIIKDANSQYVTGHYGKWHLDVPASTTPQAVGYDMGSDPPIPADEVDPWGVFGLAGVANNFMQDRVANGDPFFLQVSYRAVHEPVRSRQVIRDKYAALPPGTVHNKIPYAAMTEDLDTSVGMVLDKINQLGIQDNTYVIYVSDNGAPLAYSANTPLREGKATVREGGIRIPYIISGPGVQAGSVSSVPVMTTDLYSTIATLAGRKDALPTNVEGADLTPLLSNAGALPAGMDHLERNYHDGGELYWHWPMNFGAGPVSRTRPSSAIRDGDFKLFVEWGEHGNADVLSLYNLSTNLSETSNLALAMPQKTAELKAKLDNYLAQVDAPFAYDVKAPVQLVWNAGRPGVDAAGWRSTTDANFKLRETWALGGGAEKPTLSAVATHQPGLAGSAFAFDGGDVMRRKYFHVGDIGPRKTTVNPGTPDYDRSASFDVWFRADNLAHNQVLWESGGANQGVSLTLGDADANGSFNDLRFRVLGVNGQNLTATVPINAFANPTADFIHATAVFNDSDAARYVEVYVNGALAMRVDGTAGAGNSLFWDAYDEAGLGRSAGAALGASGGGGALPFNGAFTGQIASADFWNTPLTAAQVAANYNAKLHAVSHGVKMSTGGALLPAARATNVALGAAESSSLQVMQERQQKLASALAINSVVNGGGMITATTSPFSAGSLAAGSALNSYLFHFDPVGSTGGAKTAAGSIEFAYDILALVTDAADVAATDPVLGSIGQYGSLADRGLQLAGGDFITISPDRRTLSFSITLAANDVSQFRVLTNAAMPGDFNGDGLVSSDDLSVWRNAVALTGFGDADGDSDTDGADYLVWQRQLGMTSSSSAIASPAPGDFNGDDQVNGDDLLEWKSAYGASALGDADGDEDTDGADFLLWQQRLGAAYFSQSTVMSTPEPGAMALLAAAAPALLAWRRRLARHAPQRSVN